MANKKKGTETRKSIVRAATKLFYENGFANVGVKDICDELGIPKSLFYYYYKDKMELSTLMWRAFLVEAYKQASDDCKYSASTEDSYSRSIFYEATYISLLKDKAMLRLFSEAVYEMPKFWFSGNGISFGASAYDGASSRLNRKDFELISSYLGTIPLMIKRFVDIGEVEVTPEEFVTFAQFLGQSYFTNDKEATLKTIREQVAIASQNLIDISAIFLRIPELMFPGEA